MCARCCARSARARGLVPRYPGVTSALGCVMADMRHDQVHTLNRPLAELDFDGVRARVEDFAAVAQLRLDAAGVRFDAVHESIELDMLYTGQTHTLSVPLAREELNAAARAGGVRCGLPRRLRPAARQHRGAGDEPAHRAHRRAPEVRPAAAGADTRPRCRRRWARSAVFHAGRWWHAQRFARLDLPVGARIEGPAILEQPDTTVWLEPGFAAEVDALGNLLIGATP